MTTKKAGLRLFLEDLRLFASNEVLPFARFINKKKAELIYENTETLPTLAAIR